MAAHESTAGNDTSRDTAFDVRNGRLSAVGRLFRLLDWGPTCVGKRCTLETGGSVPPVSRFCQRLAAGISLITCSFEGVLPRPLN